MASKKFERMTHTFKMVKRNRLIPNVSRFTEKDEFGTFIRIHTYIGNGVTRVRALTRWNSDPDVVQVQVYDSVVVNNELYSKTLLKRSFRVEYLRDAVHAFTTFGRDLK